MSNNKYIKANISKKKKKKETKHTTKHTRKVVGKNGMVIQIGR